MAYDGQGQRLSLTGHQAGQSLTTRYLLDGSQMLAATASGQTTYSLIGVGEYQEDWIYYLVDGTNSVCQTTEPQGQVRARAASPRGARVRTYCILPVKAAVTHEQTLPGSSTEGFIAESGNLP